MNNKNLMIGLGVLAVAGIAYYMYKKPKTTTDEKTSKFSNARGGCSPILCDQFCGGVGYGDCLGGACGCRKIGMS
jgi:hypothetical protein